MEMWLMEMEDGGVVGGVEGYVARGKCGVAG